MRIFLLSSFLCVAALTQAQTAKDYCRKAEKYLDANKPELAYQEINKALLKDSLNQNYLYVKGLSLAGQEKWKEAYDLYSKVVDLYPEEARPYFERGQYLTRIGQFDDAISDFDTGIPYAPNDSIQFLMIGGRAIAKGYKRDFTGAYKDLMACYYYDTTNAYILGCLGNCCDDAGHSDETIMFLQKALAIDSNNQVAVLNMGFKYQKMGEHAKAIPYFTRVISISPNEGRSYNNRGLSRLKLGDIKGAKADIAKSIELYPENSYVYKNRALIFIEEKQFDKACLDLQTAIAKGFTEVYGNEAKELMEKYCK